MRYDLDVIHCRKDNVGLFFLRLSCCQHKKRPDKIDEMVLLNVPTLRQRF